MTSLLVRLLPGLLLGAVGVVVGPLLLQWLGLSGTAAVGVGVGVTVGAPVVGAVWILLRRGRAGRRRAHRPADSSRPSGSPRLSGSPRPRPVPGPSAQEDDVNPTGRWTLAISTPLGRQRGELDVSADGEALTGTAHVLGGSVPVANGSVAGDEMRFTLSVTRPMPMDLDFRLAVDGDTLDGTVTAGPMGEQKVVGERV